MLKTHTKRAPGTNLTRGPGGQHRVLLQVVKMRLGFIGAHAASATTSARRVEDGCDGHGRRGRLREDEERRETVCLLFPNWKILLTPPPPTRSDVATGSKWSPFLPSCPPSVHFPSEAFCTIARKPSAKIDKMHTRLPE